MQRVPSAGRPEIVERYKGTRGGRAGGRGREKVDGREGEVETLKVVVAMLDDGGGWWQKEVAKEKEKEEKLIAL